MKIRQGYTLIEAIIYAALLATIAVLAVNFLLQVLNVYLRARAEREVLSNARLILETVSKAIAEAAEIYYPTSKFYKDDGQLSLITPSNALPEHTTAYVDFWINEGFMYMRQEGVGTTTLSAASVRVNKFRLERIVQGLGREAVKITLQVSNAPAKVSASTTLNSTIVLKGNY